MAITKTKFIQYARCPKVIPLLQVQKETWDSIVSLEAYRQEEQKELVMELEEMEVLENDYLEVMMPYYEQVEIQAGLLAPRYFDGTFKFSKDTLDQESFDCKIHGIRYLCYVDIYNETEQSFRIIEAKATTSSKFRSLGYTKKGIFYPFFVKDEKGIYRLHQNNVHENEKAFSKLFSRYTSHGKYIYDLAVQRFIIEQDLFQNQMEEEKKKVEYYLAVLESDYEYQENYQTDENGLDIIAYIDLTEVTSFYMSYIWEDQKMIEQAFAQLTLPKTGVGPYCEKKGLTPCPFVDVCFHQLPEKNSIYSYMDSYLGFFIDGEKKSVEECYNMGYYHMLDIKEEWLERHKNKIQREVVETGIPYLDLEKIEAGLQELVYPIYHLDFESFPCPFPRFAQEKPYTQSVFQFSVHIERGAGVCDKELDHYQFLAPDFSDHREELVQALCEVIDLSQGGTVLVYNESFEKTRLKELAHLFPAYQDSLLQIRNSIFDLMYLIKTNTKFYESLGFDQKRASFFNYYHKDLNGSFSIKKVLPLFSTLSYQGMEIANGNDAIVTYAKFNRYSKSELQHKRQKLIEYCKQDTWAMVEILNGLRDLSVKKCQKNVECLNLVKI